MLIPFFRYLEHNFLFNHSMKKIEGIPQSDWPWEPHLLEATKSHSFFHKGKIALALFLLLQSGYPTAAWKHSDAIENPIAEIELVDAQIDPIWEENNYDFKKYNTVPYSSLFGKEDKELSESEKNAKKIFIADVAKQINAIKWTNDLPLKSITFSNQSLSKKYGFPGSVHFSFKNSKHRDGKVSFLIDSSLAQDPVFLQNSNPDAFQIIGKNPEKVKDPTFVITIWERRFLVKSAIPGVVLDGIKMVKNPHTQKLEIHMPVKAIWLFTWTIKRDGEKRGKDIYNCYYWVPFGWEKILSESVRIIDISK